jgi:hypothetical protein
MCAADLQSYFLPGLPLSRCALRLKVIGKWLGRSFPIAMFPNTAETSCYFAITNLPRSTLECPATDGWTFRPDVYPLPNDFADVALFDETLNRFVLLVDLLLETGHRPSPATHLVKIVALQLAFGNAVVTRIGEPAYYYAGYTGHGNLLTLLGPAIPRRDGTKA